jgi:lactate dehydrogenase-like 2-hydroxyacid dehydrogenase
MEGVQYEPRNYFKWSDIISLHCPLNDNTKAYDK